MSITPDEVQKARHKDLQPHFYAAEKIIDNLLIDGETCIDVKKFEAAGLRPDLQLTLQRKIKKSYEEAGWGIKINSDQREGVTWWQFTRRVENTAGRDL